MNYRLTFSGKATKLLLSMIFFLTTATWADELEEEECEGSFVKIDDVCESIHDLSNADYCKYFDKKIWTGISDDSEPYAEFCKYVAQIECENAGGEWIGWSYLAYCSIQEMLDCIAENDNYEYSWDYDNHECKSAERICAEQINDGKGKVWIDGQCRAIGSPLLTQLSAGNIRVYATSSAIVLKNVPAGAKVEVYNLKGKSIYSSHAPLDQINVRTKGIYMVKINGKIFKMVKFL